MYNSYIYIMFSITLTCGKQGSPNLEKLRSDTSEAQDFWRWNMTGSLTLGSL